MSRYNLFNETNSGERTHDTELINMPLDHAGLDSVQKKTPFDWFILSVLGCLCFPYTGMCGVYYAWRANHGVDFKVDPGLVKRHNRKAKILTIFSICLGVVLLITVLILTIV